MKREVKKTLIIPTKRDAIPCGANLTALVGYLWYLVCVSGENVTAIICVGR